MRVITGCLQATPVAHRPVLSGLPSCDLFMQSHRIKVAQKSACTEGHLLHDLLLSFPTQQPPWLKSRHPFARPAHQLLAEADGMSAENWMIKEWRTEWDQLNLH